MHFNALSRSSSRTSCHASSVRLTPLHSAGDCCACFVAFRGNLALSKPGYSALRDCADCGWRDLTHLLQERQHGGFASQAFSRHLRTLLGIDRCDSPVLLELSMSARQPTNVHNYTGASMRTPLSRSSTTPRQDAIGCSRCFCRGRGHPCSPSSPSAKWVDMCV